MQNLAAIRGAIFEALKRGEETYSMYDRFSKEAKDKLIADFFRGLADEVRSHMTRLKNLNIHSIAKFGLTIRFETTPFSIDEKHIMGLIDKDGSKELLKLAIDEINADIEYYNHIAEHSVFPETKRMFRVIADKELDHKSKMKALMDLLE